MIKYLYIFFSPAVFLLVCFHAEAQVDMDINGLGRGVLTNNQLAGNILENDTTSARKGLSGYNLFDLGFNFERRPEFGSNVIFRVRQPWGDFWGEQSAFEFRQLQIMGTLKGISFELGDIDMKMTPYTLFNSDEMFNRYEAEIFRNRREIVQYENFNTGNFWRLQGLQLGTTAYMNKILNEIQFKYFGVRTNATDEFTMPDRILTGGSVHAVKTRKLRTGINYVGLLDLAKRDFPVNYRNNVLTGEIDLMLLDRDSLTFGLFAEGGFSDMNYYMTEPDSSFRSASNFIDGGVKALVKKFTIRLSYKNTGANFNSPSAQTMRVNVDRTPLLFGSVMNNTMPRSQLLFDRFTQEQIYNRSLSPVLGNFIPYFNNVTPYGEATPNRSGVTLDISRENPEQFIQFYTQARYFTEVAGVGTHYKRNFLSGTAGVKISLDKYLALRRSLLLTLGDRLEQTTRGDGSVNLTSNLIDAGILATLTDHFDITAGTKLITANGTEVLTVYNVLNLPEGYYEMNVNLTETIVSLGGRIRFNETTSFNFNYNLIAFRNNLNTTLSYNISQLFLNFNILF